MQIKSQCYPVQQRNPLYCRVHVSTQRKSTEFLSTYFKEMIECLFWPETHSLVTSEDFMLQQDY